jgi:carboxylesterase
MDREEIGKKVLAPLDWLIGATFGALERAHLLEPVAAAIYLGMKTSLKTQFKLFNYLKVEGVENLPASGGVLLASNHQSWLDVHVIGASSPRKVHFIAKSEFKEWPVVRHLVKAGESVFIERRGGDKNALVSIANQVRQGWVVAVFPEGTIPGEEEIPRRAVEPETGLLKGRTGVVRLAIMAGVPIIPVGISGTGRALPPELYPRLEILRMPASTPISIRFGEPLSYAEHHGKPFDRDVLRRLTDDLMRRISRLVDHKSNFRPITVPIPPPLKQDKIGVLLLHGFTSHVNTVSGLVPYLQAAGLEYEMPVLRGHGTRFEDLEGVTHEDWYADAERALIDLWRRVDQVVIVGFSMGGLVALELAMRHPDKLAGVVTLAAAVKFKDPLARYARQFASLRKYWPNPTSFNDEDLALLRDKNYKQFPTETFASVYDYSREVTRRLRKVHVPIRILQSKKDQIISPVAANIIYERVSSPRRDIVWYKKSGHAMLQDMEAEKVCRDVMEFVLDYVRTKP